MYQPTLESIRQHPLPAWYDDCKLGIFIHWGLYSVPAFAPQTGQLGEIELDEYWFSHNPYAEWYYNSVKLGHGPSYEHHVKTYGADYPYENFAKTWKAEKFDATQWAQLFEQSGAGYVVLTTKHHDGFCLWPSRHTDYNSAQQGPGRDLMGELTQAVRAHGMKMGTYYSGVIDWRYTNAAMHDQYEVHHPDNVQSVYADYAYNQVMELIERYKPEVLWNDIGWPLKGLNDLPYLFSHYYNTVPDGVVDDRWNGLWCDFTSKEYLVGEKTLSKKWEMCRGMGLSFGYNSEEDATHTISGNDLISLLIDTVAYNGNLLINIGPKADGTIPALQQERLLYLGAWLAKNKRAIYGTKPFTKQEEALGGTAKAYYTQNDTHVFSVLDHLPQGDSTFALTLGCGKTACALDPACGARVRMENGVLHVTLTGIAPNATPIAIAVER